MMSVDGKSVELGALKQRAVLALFVLNRNRAVAVESLIDAVWGQSPVPAARVTTQSYVSNLRRLLSNAGFDARAVLAKAPPGYRLNVVEAACDLDRFNTEQKLTSANLHPHESLKRTDLAQRALQQRKCEGDT